MADNLPPSSDDVTDSGSINLPEPSGPYKPVMGLLYFTAFGIKICLLGHDIMFFVKYVSALCLKMEAVSSSESLISIQPTTMCHNPEDNYSV
jgi:hypothetical protein